MGCSQGLPGSTEETRNSVLCTDTLVARQVHAQNLIVLDTADPKQRAAKVTGAVALSGVAGGCGELTAK